MNPVHRIRIAIDPMIVTPFGPEVHWTWRTILASIGWGWHEVGAGESCDIAYWVNPAEAPKAHLVIRADPDQWQQMHELQFAGFELGQNDLPHVQFAGESSLNGCPDESDGFVLCLHDLPLALFWLLTGQMEKNYPQDRHGFYDFGDSPALAERLFHRAPVSAMIGWIERRLRQHGAATPIAPWPGGKGAAAAVTHDVDYPQVKRWIEPLRIVRRLGPKSAALAWQVLAGRRNYWHFDNWMALEALLQTRSAFYFVARQGSLFEYATGTPDPFYDVNTHPFRDLFSLLRNEGFEIGLHASYRACESTEGFSAQRETLEHASAGEILGNRHHYWHLDPADADRTLLMHESIGLLYDASLFHNRYMGWRRGSCQPFYPFHRTLRRGLKTLQLPTAWMDDQSFGLKQDNPGDDHLLLTQLADCVLANGGCMVINIHDYVFDDDLFPGWTRTFHRLWEYLLESGEFWLATPLQIAQHWQSRFCALATASTGLEQGR